MSSYAQLIDAPDIDAVYNALPPSMHEHWSIAAMQRSGQVDYAVCFQKLVDLDNFAGRH